MKYILFVCLFAFGVSQAAGQSAQVEFFVSGKDSSVLSVLQLVCTSPTDTATYPFNGKQRITAGIGEGTVCWLDYVDEVSVKPKFTYHFIQIASGTVVRPMAENLKTGERRILGTRVQLMQQEQVYEYARQDSIEGAVPMVQAVPVQQLSVALRVDVSKHLPERKHPVIRSCRGGTITYIDGIPVGKRTGSPAVSAYSGSAFYPYELGVSAEFENETDVNRNR